MKEAHTHTYSDDLDDVIDLKDLYRVLLKGKWIIVSVTTFISIIGVIYSLLLPNIYESKALLVPVNSSNNYGALQSYSGLAGLAGINLPSGVTENNSVKALKKINSLSFFENNILENINLPDLMAVNSWNRQTNTLSYDESVYNKTTNSWLGSYSYPEQKMPSAQLSFKIFRTKHLNISEDKKSGFITLSIKHQSPFVAKQWVELVVDQINAFYRQKDRLESEKAVNYLNQQISTTGLSEIKQVIAQLLQEETKKLTLIEANQYYVFDYIDPPAVMEQKIEPKRSLICVFFAIFGAMLSIALVLIRHYIFNKRA